MKILDSVWMLVDETHHKPIVIYCISISERELWNRVIKEELMGTGVTRKQLEEKGFKATKVSIVKDKNAE